MGRVFVNGKPLEEDWQKFIRLFHLYEEVGLTACAAVRVTNDEKLAELEKKLGNLEAYKFIPSDVWERNPEDERALIKIYRVLDNPETYSQISGRIQKIEIPMPFLGKYGEFQLRIKRKAISNGKEVDFLLVKLGRKKSFDSRIGKWVEETKPIEPKMDEGTHGYVSLRLYHQDHLPENQPDWHFEPVYVSIAGEDFYRIDDVEWKDETIVIAATLLDDDSPEIPKFLRR